MVIHLVRTQYFPEKTVMLSQPPTHLQPPTPPFWYADWREIALAMNNQSMILRVIHLVYTQSFL